MRQLKTEALDELLELEDEEYILTRSPEFQKMLAAMDEDIAGGNYRSFRQYLKEKKPAP